MNADTALETGLPGTMNGPAAGIIIKEMVRRAMAFIAANRMTFEAKEKHVDYKTARDFVTDVDVGAQEIYRRMIAESFPGYGVVAEEEGLSTSCSIPGENIWFTVDPLDGTKAFIRRQSTGIGTMISLVRNNVVIAACVGDVMTREIYYYRPDSDKVHRFSWNDTLHEELSIKPGSIKDEYILLGDDPRGLSPVISEITGRGLMFKSMEVSSGSIGIKMARLWKGEVGAVVIASGMTTPWDWNPIAGISAKLGFAVLMRFQRAWEVSPLRPIKMIVKIPNDIIVIHHSRVDEFIKRFNS
ncbi:MAG: inositol monophosphatase family protein [Patescibacteria group bacterium]|nr:inositol monophosphatase family protein [Patescibacteria group bacterium]MDE2116639.1 inositol monophosphatase family protein [Patescibacteria group bacterium]